MASSNGDDRVMATAHQILRTFGSDNANDMLQILSSFDDRFSAFSLSHGASRGRGNNNNNNNNNINRHNNGRGRREEEEEDEEGEGGGGGEEEEEEEGVAGGGGLLTGGGVVEGLFTDPELVSAQELILKWDFGAASDPDPSRHAFIWTENFEEAGAYLAAVDAIQAFVARTSTSTSSSSGRRRADLALVDHAKSLLQIAMLRLEEELRNLLDRYSQPADPAQLFEIVYGGNRGEGGGRGRRGRGEAAEKSDDDDDDDDDDGGGGGGDGDGDGDDGSDDAMAPVCIDLLQPDTLLDACDIAARMIAGGYASECKVVLVASRREMVEESLRALGMRRPTIEEVQRMAWEELEDEIRKWVAILRASIRVLFRSERELCRKVLKSGSGSGSGSGSESGAVFADIARAPMTHLLNFAEAVAIARRAPEKLFKILDMYEALRDSEPAIAELFSGPESEALRAEAAAVVGRLADAARSTLAEFESRILRDPSRVATAGGAISPLTRYVMNYVKFFSEYTRTLNEVLRDRRQQPPPQPASSSSSSDAAPSDSGSGSDRSPLTLATLSAIDLLERNLDAKSLLYRDPALACLFLMNNLHYIVQKAKEPELRRLLAGGDDWIRRKNGRLLQHHNEYRRTAWARVLACLRDDGISFSSSGSAGASARHLLRERFRSFNAAFEDTVRTQSSWIVPDPQLCAELQISVTEMILPAYRSFLGRFLNHLDARHPEKYVRYSPEDIEGQINELFEGTHAAGSLHRRRSTVGT